MANNPDRKTYTDQQIHKEASKQIIYYRSMLSTVRQDIQRMDPSSIDPELLELLEIPIPEGNFNHESVAFRGDTVEVGYYYLRASTGQYLNIFARIPDINLSEMLLIKSEETNRCPKLTNTFPLLESLLIKRTGKIYHRLRQGNQPQINVNNELAIQAANELRERFKSFLDS